MEKVIAENSWYFMLVASVQNINKNDNGKVITLLKQSRNEMIIVLIVILNRDYCGYCDTENDNRETESF